MPTETDQKLRSEILNLFQYVQRLREEIGCIVQQPDGQTRFGKMSDQLDAILTSTGEAILGRDPMRAPFEPRGAFLMSRFRSLLIAAAATSALAACSLSPPAPKTSIPPPSPALGRDLPAATAGSAYGVANTGGAFPHGAIRKGDSDVAQEPTAETTEEIVLMGLDSTVKITPSTTSERYREDADSCSAYARGEVAHDTRIEIDVNAAFESEAGGLGLAALRRRMSHFERTRRVPSLFNSCMVAKGYSRPVSNSP